MRDFVISDQEFRAVASESFYYDDPDNLVAVVGPNLIFPIIDQEDLTRSEEPVFDIQEMAEAVRTIWHIYRDPFRDFLKLTGQDPCTFAERFCIPHIWVREWMDEVSSPPYYVRLMLAELCGLVPFRE